MLNISDKLIPGNTSKPKFEKSSLFSNISCTNAMWNSVFSCSIGDMTQPSVAKAGFGTFVTKTNESETWMIRYMMMNRLAAQCGKMLPRTCWRRMTCA